MRIFFPSAAELLTDREGNGEGLIAWHLLSALSDRGHEVVACVVDARLSVPPPFEVVKIGQRNRFQAAEPLAYARAVDRELKRRGTAQFDVAHWLFPDGGPGFSAQSLGGLPLVIGPLVQPWPAPRRWWPIGFTARRLLAPVLYTRSVRLWNTAAALLIAEPGAAERVPARHRARTHVVPFGIRLNTFPTQPLPPTPTILFLGRLEPSKGVSDLVAAMPRVVGKLPNARLIVAGDGSDARMLRQRTGQLGLTSSILFRGHVPANEVADLIAGASLLCLPSHGEPFGMVLLEAMASGRAVVATNVGGPASIVIEGRGGRLVAPRDVESLAHALVSMLSDEPALAAAGRFNRARVESEYSLESVVDRLEHVYSSVTKGRAKSPQ